MTEYAIQAYNKTQLINALHNSMSNKDATRIWIMSSPPMSIDISRRCCIGCSCRNEAIKRIITKVKKVPVSAIFFNYPKFVLVE